MNSTTSSSPLKLVSVVIPCRNEVEHIGACVESILQSDYPSLEIFVIDGMSDDGTREVISGLVQKYSNVFKIDNLKQLTPFAFNLGIKAAQGEFVQIVGSRNVLARDYISKLVDTLSDNSKLGCVGGDCEHTFETQDGRWISYAMESSFGVGGSNFRVQKKDTYVDTAGVPLFRRAVFEEVGYFDEELTRNQDDDFSFRLIQNGFKIFYRHDAKVTYLVRPSYTKAFWQYFQYGYFKVFVNKKHGALTTSRQLVPMCFILFLAFGLILSFVWPQLLPIYLGVLILYMVLGFRAAGNFTSRPGEKLYVQKAILCLHLGYGLGYLRGLIDFFVLNKKPSSELQKLTT